jgi:FAD dependent oxidoreductase
MRQQQIQSDITVIGGGLAGVCAAIAAARLGQRVALVQNRGVLGGNSSSEIRVWVSSATAHGIQRYARETGIMGELFRENEYTNPEGNPYLWDLVLLDAVKREANIRLFLNTDVRQVNCQNNRILEVGAWQAGSESELTFASPYFMDCSGDGLVGHLAGAEYRRGREAKHEFHEDWADQQRDDSSLGSTIFFYTKDAGRPVPFVAPSFAIDIKKTSIPQKRIIRSGDNGCKYWWIEWGGELDTIHDNERIRDELWGVVYGIWDHIKNSGEFPEAANMTLEWVGSVPGKRESRRFIGDYTLTQQDILEQREFPDAVAFGGWSIDLHPPQGVYSYESACKQRYSDGIYQIPYRTLYSHNIGNLFFAGRNISATHIAFGSTRVMATCATLGEAVGTAAALCLQLHCTPRELYQQHSQRLQQTLLRQDASLIGVAKSDPHDLAPSATVRASSHLEQIRLETSHSRVVLDHDYAVLLPVQQHLQAVEFLLDASQKSQLVLEVYNTSKPQNYVPHQLLTHKEIGVEAGQAQWVRFELGLNTQASENVFLVLRQNPALHLHLHHQSLIGLQMYQHQPFSNSGDLNESKGSQPVNIWNPRNHHRKLPCLRVLGSQDIFAPSNVVNPWARPYGNPNAWVAQPEEQAWLELRWAQPQSLKELHITFNDDVNEDLINLHHHRSPWRIIPEIVRDYRIEICTAQGWQCLSQHVGNRHRKQVHALGVETNAVRIVVEQTNGAPRAEIMQVRVY